jgi:hypothetical protein
MLEDALGLRSLLLTLPGFPPGAIVAVDPLALEGGSLAKARRGKLRTDRAARR